MPGFDAIGAASIGGILTDMDGTPYLSIQDARGSISTLLNAVQDNRIPISTSLAVQQDGRGRISTSLAALQDGRFGISSALAAIQDGRTRIFYIDSRRMPVVRLYSKGPAFISSN